MSAAVHPCLKLGRGWWPVAFTPPSEFPAHLSGLCHLSLGRNVVCNLGGPSSRCPSAASGEGPAAAGTGWWVRESHTPTCKCPSCLSLCISILIGKKCSLGFPAERYCLLDIRAGAIRGSEKGKQVPQPEWLKALRLSPLIGACRRASLRNSAFLRTCPPPLQHLLPHPVLLPPPSVSYCGPHSEQEEVYGSRLLPPHPPPGPRMPALWSQSPEYQWGPRWDDSIGSCSWSVFPVCEG